MINNILSKLKSKILGLEFSKYVPENGDLIIIKCKKELWLRGTGEKAMYTFLENLRSTYDSQSKALTIILVPNQVLESVTRMKDHQNEGDIINNDKPLS